VLTFGFDDLGNGGPITIGKRDWARPAVVASFIERLDALQDATGRAESSSVLARRTDFALEASVAFLEGKALGGFSRRALPLWRTRDRTGGRLAEAFAKIVKDLESIAELLRKGTTEAMKANSKDQPKAPARIMDAFLAERDPALGESREKAFLALASAATTEEIVTQLEKIREDFIAEAKKRALAAFDEALPVQVLDAAASRTLLARRRLIADLWKPAKAAAKDRNGKSEAA
jgi:hypothetical protein